MSGRIYPRDSTPPVSGEHPHPKPIIESPPLSGQHNNHHRPTSSQDSFTSSTYVVQIPKDQIYRVPPPENAHKYKLYTQSKSPRTNCRCCLCSLLATLLLLILTLAVLTAVFKPKSPSYSIHSLQINGVNLSTTPSTDAVISPLFNVTIRSHNPNGKIGIYYVKGSSVKVYHNGVNLCDGELPVFYQPPKNVTLFSTELSGAGIVLSKSARDRLLNEQKSGHVPLVMHVKVPVKIKVGAVKTWTITVKVTCDVTVNALTEKGKVVSKDCRTHVKPW